MPDRATLDAFIAQVISGDPVEAIRDWYADDASMQENQEPPRVGREALMATEPRLARFGVSLSRSSAMRIIFGLSALALLSGAPTFAQAQYAPRGSYERQCRDIRMEGQFLHATCRGPDGPAVSSINVASCSTDIYVGADGGLACIGPGGGAPPSVRDAPPGYDDRPDYGYPSARDAPGDYDVGSDRGYRGGRRGGRPDTVTLSAQRNWGGRPIRIDGPVANLDEMGLNDRVRSIRLERGSGPWIVCTDANYRGRCRTLYASVGDTRRIGMGDSISSLRPLR